MKNKSFITALLFVAFMLSFAFGVVFLSTATAKVAATTVTGNAITQEVESFAMKGSQVRISGDKSGLRFLASIDKDEYDALVEEYDVEMGMLVIPKNKLTGSLDLDNDVDPIKVVSRQGTWLAEDGDEYAAHPHLAERPHGGQQHRFF